MVFDTTVVVSALLFTSGRLAWLRAHWRAGDALPLASRATIEELTRVLRYPKFQLCSDNRDELLAEYLPYCEIVKVTRKSKLACRDKNDQPFLDLAESGKADLWSPEIETSWLWPGKRGFSLKPPQPIVRAYLACRTTPFPEDRRGTVLLSFQCRKSGSRCERLLRGTPVPSPYLSGKP